MQISNLSIKRLFTSLVLGSIFFSQLGTALAQEKRVWNASEEDQIQALVEEYTITRNDIGGQDAGLLGTNPFYFMKNWRRSTQRAFVGSTLKKADLEIDILNEKIAEVKRLEEIVPDNEDGLLVSLDNYQNSLNAFSGYAQEGRTDTDIAAKNNLIDRLIKTAFLHIRLLDATKQEDATRINERLEATKHAIALVTVQVAGTLLKDSLIDHLQRVRTAVAGGNLTDWFWIEFSNRLQSEATAPLKWQITKWKEELDLRLVAALESNDTDLVFEAFFNRISGSLLERLKVVEALRQVVTDNELKARLAFLEDQFMNKGFEQHELGKVAANQLINEVIDLQQATETGIKTATLKGVPNSGLLTTLRFNLTQAQNAFSLNQYQTAFGHALLAYVAGQQGIYQLSVIDGKDWKTQLSNELLALKIRYDALAQLKIDVSLRTSIESKLAKISDLISAKKVNADAFFSALKEVQILLAKAEL